VKNGISYINRCLVLLILMIYIFVSLTYILCLPTRNFTIAINNPGDNFSVVNAASHTESIGATSSNEALLRHLYKSIPEKKVKLVVAVLLIGAILIFSGLIIPAVFRKKYNYLLAFVEPPFEHYLKFCTLRI